MFQRALRRRRGTLPDPEPLYLAVVDRARAPALFAAGGVPDTLDGRFESLVLHLFLVLRRLRAEATEQAAGLAQGMVDLFFVDMDESLREIGVGDLSVGRKVKTMASAFYGRIDAYEQASGAGDAQLADALRRNLFGTVQAEEAALRAMVSYLRKGEAALAGAPLADLVAGRAAFPPLPAEEDDRAAE